MSSNPPRPSLAILVALCAIGPFAHQLLIPSLPALQDAFRADYQTVQLAISLALIGVGCAQLVYGPWSDRWGRRPVLLVGLALFALGSLVCRYAPSIETLIVGRLVQAVGGCAGLVLGRAIVRDLYDRDRAASMIGYVTMAMVVAPMVAPLIGGYLEVRHGWQAGFALVAALGAALIGAAWLKLHETHRPGGAASSGLRQSVSDFGRLLRLPAFCVYATHLSFSTAIFFTFLAGAPYVMMELLGRGPIEYGLCFMAVSLGYMLGNFGTARLVRRTGIDRMIRVGTAISLVGAALLAAVTLAGTLTPLWLFGCMSAAAFGNGLSLPTGMSAAISVEPGVTGTASGLAGALQMVAGAVASWIVAALLTDSAAPLALVMLGCATAAFLAPLLGRDATRRHARRQSSRCGAPPAPQTRQPVPAPVETAQ